MLETGEDTGRTIIPTEFVTSTAKKLFGPDVILNFNVFADEGSTDEQAGGAASPCIWNEQENTISVLMTSFEGYNHKVTKVSKKSGAVTCTVEYISPYNEEVISKTMKYILNKNPETNEYYISAIREAD